MNIDCRQLCELLFDYVNGDLADDRLDTFEAHLKVCPPCVIHVETYRVTIKLSGKLPCRCLPPEMEQRLRAAIARECPGRMMQDD